LFKPSSAKSPPPTGNRGGNGHGHDGGRTRAIACGVKEELGMGNVRHFFIPEPTARAVLRANLAPTAFNPWYTSTVKWPLKRIFDRLMPNERHW
jgi:hypothetical protein